MTSALDAPGVEGPELGGLARWERYWFGPASLVRLAAFRIVLLAAAFDGIWVVRRAVFQYVQRSDPVFLRRTWNPIYAFELLGLGPPGPELARWLWGALVLAIALGILGLFTRLACAVVALLSFYWIGIEYSIGKPHHTCVALMFGLCALPFAPVGARLSLTSLVLRLRAARRGDDPRGAPELGAWAAFPLRLTQITIALGYFFAGSTKLAKSGLAWVNGYTLQGIMVEFGSVWTDTLSRHHALLVGMSIGLLVGQIGFPLVLFWRASRWFFLPVAILFHVTAMQTMSTGAFLTLWLTLVAFLELERVPAFLARVVGEGHRGRRLMAGLLLAGFACGTTALYLARKPEWLGLLFLPPALAFVLMCCPRFLAPLELAHDPSSARARRALAWITAGDWAGRIRLRASPGSALRAWDHRGRELVGARRALAILLRMPLALLVAPFLWRDMARQESPPQIYSP